MRKEKLEIKKRRKREHQLRKQKRKKKEKPKPKKPIGSTLPIFKVVTITGEPNGLENVVRKAVKKILADPSEDLARFLKSITCAYLNKANLLARYGYLVYASDVKSLNKTINLWTLEWEIFKRIPPEEADQYLITGTFEVDLSSAITSNIIVIRCHHLLEKRTPFGTGYFGNAFTTINRINFSLYFMGHAIGRIKERVFERLGKGVGSYSQVFSILGGPNPTIGKITYGDQALVSFYIRSTLTLEDAQLWKVAYGTCVLEGREGGIKTILKPGMKVTPENRLLARLAKQGASQGDLNQIQKNATAFSLFCWLNGQADSLITPDGKPVQPPKLNVKPKEFIEIYKSDDALMEALDSWGIGYVAKYMRKGKGNENRQMGNNKN